MTNLFDGIEFERVSDETPMSTATLAKSCKGCIVKHGAEFEQIFGQRIQNFMSGIHFIIGFDIVGFDKRVVQSVDGKSCAETITDKYGQRASELVRELLEYPKM